jgi:hypothetical protein
MKIGVLAMTVIVVASNYLVQFPVNDWITWGAFTYPLAFLVTDTTNRAFGPTRARQVVYVGFIIAVILSIALATPRIALASGTAFLVAQLLDVRIFDRMRERGGWWTAPLLSSSIGSALDTALFFFIAFAGTMVPWITLGLGDFAVKLALALSMLIPFRLMMQFTRPHRI